MEQPRLINAPIESYSTPVAAAVAKITYRQLRTWTEDGLISPSIADTTGPGVGRRWSIRDLTTLCAIARLRKAGVFPKDLKKIAAILSAYEAEWKDTFLIYNDTDVGLRRGKEVISIWKNPGQLVMMFVVSMEQIEREVREAVKKAA